MNSMPKKAEITIKQFINHGAIIGISTKKTFLKYNSLMRNYNFNSSSLRMSGISIKN